MLQTEYEFNLPMGYVDDEGNLHRDGVMRLATAADEILPFKDPRVQANEAYLIVVLLSRVVSRLGSLGQVNPKVIEGLFAGDMDYLQSLYNHINRNGNSRQKAHCPKCEHAFEVELDGLGESLGYPLKALHEEVAYIAYHFHWPREEIMHLEHPERRRWVAEITAINEEMNT